MAAGLVLVGPIVGATAATTGAAVATAAAISAATIFSYASLAWSIGSTLFSLFGGSSSTVSGPRLKDTHVQSAAHGQPIKRFWGVDRMAGQVVWVGSNGKGGRGMRQHKHTEGGKGGGGDAVTTFTYDIDFAVSINGASNCVGVRRIWAYTKLIYDVSKDAPLESQIGTGIRLKGKSGTVTFYDGAEDQEPPAAIEELAGVGNTSAYRNQFLAVFTKFKLADYGNKLPDLSFECYTVGEESFSEVHLYDLDSLEGQSTGPQTSWGYVSPSGEIPIMFGVSSANYQHKFTSGAFNGQFKFRTYLLTAADDAIPTERVQTEASNASLASSVGGSSFLGHSDTPGYVTSSAGDAIWWDVETNTATVLRNLAAHLPGWVYPTYAKKGNDIYFTRDGGVIAKFSLATGEFVASVNVGADLDNLMVGDSFIWGLHAGTHGSPSTDTLYKVDLATLTLDDTINLGTNDSIGALYVDTDDLIYMVGGDDSGFSAHINFYKYENDELTLIGTATSPTNAHGLGGTDSTLVVRNGLWYTGRNQFAHYNTDIHVWGSGVEVDCVPLWQIVRDICIADGLEESEIDVSELTDCVRGYTLDGQGSGRDAILPLQRYGFFDARERDLKIDFLKRGQEPVAVIREADMAARPSLTDPLPPLLDIVRAQESELPIRVHLRFKDQDANYQTGHAYTSRLTSESKHTVTVDVPVVMTADKAKQIANVLHANYWLERSPKETRLSRKHMLLDAADPVSLEMAA